MSPGTPTMVARRAVTPPEGNDVLNTAVATLQIVQPIADDEFETLRRDLGKHWAAAELVDIDGVLTIQLTLAGDKPIDLSTVPPGKVLHLQVQARPRTQTLAFAGLRPDSVVALTILDLPSNQDIKTLHLDDCHGQVRVVSTVRGVRLICTEAPHVDGFVGDVPREQARSVVLQGDASLTVDDVLDGTMLVLDGGTVSPELGLSA